MIIIYIYIIESTIILIIMYLCIVLDIDLLLYGSFVPCSPCRHGRHGSLGSRAEDSIPVSWDHRKLVALLTWSELILH